MKRSVTGSGWRCYRRAAAVAATTVLVATGALVGAPSVAAIDPPTIDPAALPPDGPPGPEQPMRQSSYCTEVGVVPGTDFRVQPKYMDMLNLPEAWRFGRGAGVKVAVIDTGVSPHPRLLNLVGGGDYVMGDGDGLSDCDAHGTLVASMIAAAPFDGVTPLPAPRQTRRPESVPTTEPAPSALPPQTITLVPAPSPVAPPPPSAEPEPAASTGDGTIAEAGYSRGGRVIGVDYPSAPATTGDAFSGVAPDVELISIRQSSQAFTTKDVFVDSSDPQARQKSDNIRTLARAIVHAANLGASVINISNVVCMNVRTLLDQQDLGAAVRYASVDRNAVIVVAAGDTGSRDCKANPEYNPLQPNDPRDWTGVNTVVTPAWFSEYVLTVGAVDSAGVPMTKTSVAGPWVSIAAPGSDIEGLSPRDDGLMNAVDGPDNSLLQPAGTGFSTAIVAGVAALVRAKYPELSSHQVINRLIHTARPPARGVDNQVGYGIVDPVAALTWDVPDVPALAPERLSAPLPAPPPPVERDMTPVRVAGAGLAAVLLAAFVILGARRMLRRMQGES